MQLPFSSSEPLFGTLLLPWKTLPTLVARLVVLPWRSCHYCIVTVLLQWQHKKKYSSWFWWQKICISCSSMLGVCVWEHTMGGTSNHNRILPIWLEPRGASRILSSVKQRHWIKADCCPLRDCLPAIQHHQTAEQWSLCYRRIIE